MRKTMLAALVALAVSLPLFAADTGTVVVYRRSAIVGRAYNPHILLNGEPLLDIRNANIWTAQLPAGHYKFAGSDHNVFTEKDGSLATVDVDVKPGETYYIETNVAMGFGKPRTSLHVVSTDEGRRSLRN